MLRRLKVSDPFKTKEFKLLKAKWDAKLAAKGFNDIESTRGNVSYLKVHECRKFHRREPQYYDETQEYFLRATHLLQTHKFGSVRERKVWELHADGWTVREIETKLKFYRNGVHQVILKLRKLIK